MSKSTLKFALVYKSGISIETLFDRYLINGADQHLALAAKRKHSNSFNPPHLESSYDAISFITTLHKLTLRPRSSDSFVHSLTLQDRGFQRITE